MLEKLDFLKRDHHLSSGGTLKPDEHKQWQIFMHLVPTLKYLHRFSPSTFLISSSILWMADGTAGVAGLGFIVVPKCQQHVCVFAGLSQSNRFVPCLGCCFPAICCVGRFRRAELRTSFEVTCIQTMSVFPLDPGRQSNLKSMCLQTKQRGGARKCVQKSGGVKFCNKYR